MQETLNPLQEELDRLDNEIGRENETVNVLKYEVQQTAIKLDKVLDGFMAKG